MYFMLLDSLFLLTSSVIITVLLKHFCICLGFFFFFLFLLLNNFLSLCYQCFVGWFFFNCLTNILYCTIPVLYCRSALRSSKQCLHIVWILFEYIVAKLTCTRKLFDADVSCRSIQLAHNNQGLTLLFIFFIFCFFRNKIAHRLLILLSSQQTITLFKVIVANHFDLFCHIEFLCKSFNAFCIDGEFFIHITIIRSRNTVFIGWRKLSTCNNFTSHHWFIWLCRWGLFNLSHNSFATKHLTKYNMATI
mmetsp:Transcript_14726/g.21989  ORF Transcript_14726/g.21989 Transcript_14726/m.21989 type:complete len:248 (-) Transcript_14726:513-1256(-)